MKLHIYNILLKFSCQSSVRTNTVQNIPTFNVSWALTPICMYAHIINMIPLNKGALSYTVLNCKRILENLGRRFLYLYRQACRFVLFVHSPCLLLRVRYRNIIFFENTFLVREHRGSSLDNQIPYI